jgi:hypothetical protein
MQLMTSTQSTWQVTIFQVFCHDLWVVSGVNLQQDLNLLPPGNYNLFQARHCTLYAPSWLTSTWGRWPYTEEIRRTEMRLLFFLCCETKGINPILVWELVQHCSSPKSQLLFVSVPETYTDFVHCSVIHWA